jgi:hypothetical protein
MPTQSLTLRGEIGRRLTIQEMDDNFTYLEGLAEEQGDQPNNQIAVGTGTGLTSSESFTFDNVCSNLLASLDSSITCGSFQSAIIGGCSNTICSNEGSVILGGYANTISCGSDYSIISGHYNNINCFFFC